MRRALSMSERCVPAVEKIQNGFDNSHRIIAHDDFVDAHFAASLCRFLRLSNGNEAERSRACVEVVEQGRAFVTGRIDNNYLGLQESCRPNTIVGRSGAKAHETMLTKVLHKPLYK